MKKNPALGLEITASAVRAAFFSEKGSTKNVASTVQREIRAGILSESYAASNINDREELRMVLRNCLSADGRSALRFRAALALPDAVFRVQTLEFDALPSRRADRDRLVRWRVEKSAAFDLSGTVLRYQVLKVRDSVFSVLVCAAKEAVVAEYESILLELGIQPWSIGPSSFSVLNLYTPHMSARSSSYALVHVTADAFTTIVAETGGVRFFRYKEVKRGTSGDNLSRLLREVEDSLHFYAHMDRTQQAQAQIDHLYIAGKSEIRDGMVRELAAAHPIDVQALSPEILPVSGMKAGTEMEAALGAAQTL